MKIALKKEQDKDKENTFQSSVKTIFNITTKNTYQERILKWVQRIYGCIGYKGYA